MSTNPSTHTVKSFALGYKVVNATLDATAAATSAVATTAVATKDVGTGFFAGMRYAVAERRGESKPAATKSDDTKLREAQDLYARAHGLQANEPVAPGLGIVVAPAGE